MKKILFLALVVFIGIFGCSKKDNSTDNQSAQSAVSEVAIKLPQDMVGVIGVSKIVSHPALDAIEQGLQDELLALGYTGLTFDIQSANGEYATAASIANGFKESNVTVAVGIATPMALALANVFKDTPIVFSAVTDAVDAGLRTTNGVQPGTNITGVSDASPIREQIELCAKLVDLKKLGFIYNAGEANSVAILRELESIAQDMGIEIISTTVTTTAEVKQAAEAIASRDVDAIYIGTDNVVAAAIGSVTDTALKYKVVTVGADPVTSRAGGALAAYGVNYYAIGRQTGKMIADILEGAKPADMPVKFMTAPDELELFVDESVAEKIGITISDEVLELAK